MLYVADQETDEVEELYIVPIDGSGPPVKLSGTLPPRGGIRTSPPPELGDDARRVVFQTTNANNLAIGVFSALLDGSSPMVRLSDPLPNTGPGNIQDTELTPDGRLVIYKVSTGIAAASALFVSPIDGSAPPRQINQSFAGVGQVYDSPITNSFGFSTDSDLVFYMARQDTFAPDELYSASLRTGVVRKWNAPLAPGTGVRGYLLSPDAARLAYVAERSVNPSVTDLYVVPTDGSAPPLRLNRELIPARRVGFSNHNVQFTRNGAWIAYLSYSRDDRTTDLFSVPADGHLQSRKINGLLLEGRAVSRFELRPGTLDVIYCADIRRSRSDDVFRAALDGRYRPHRLSHDPGSPFVNVASFTLSPGGERVQYEIISTSSTPGGLYTVAADGSLSPALVVQPMPTVPSSQITRGFSRDGQHVLFAADLAGNGRRPLYSALADGSSRPTSLSGPVAPGGSVGSAQVSPDMQRLVYLATQDSSGVRELYSIPFAPVLDTVSPSQGPPLGGSPVVLTGSGFTHATEVFFDGRPALGVTRMGPNTLHVLSPPTRPGASHLTERGISTLSQRGTVDVQVREGFFVSTLQQSYRYAPQR